MGHLVIHLHTKCVTSTLDMFALSAYHVVFVARRPQSSRGVSSAAASKGLTCLLRIPPSLGLSLEGTTDSVSCARLFILSFTILDDCNAPLRASARALSALI